MANVQSENRFGSTSSEEFSIILNCLRAMKESL